MDFLPIEERVELADLITRIIWIYITEFVNSINKTTINKLKNIHNKYFDECKIKYYKNNNMFRQLQIFEHNKNFMIFANETYKIFVKLWKDKKTQQIIINALTNSSWYKKEWKERLILLMNNNYLF